MHAIEQRADAPLSGIRHRPMVGDGKSELLVLGPDSKLRLCLAASFEPSDEFVARLDRCHVDLVSSHAQFRNKGPRR